MAVDRDGLSCLSSDGGLPISLIKPKMLSANGGSSQVWLFSERFASHG